MIALGEVFKKPSTDAITDEGGNKEVGVDYYSHETRSNTSCSE